MIKSSRLQAGLDPRLMNVTKDPISFGPSILHSAVSTPFKADSHCGKRMVVYISSGYMLSQREREIDFDFEIVQDLRFTLIGLIWDTCSPFNKARNRLH